LAERVVQLTGSRSKVVHGEKPQDDPLQRQPDIAQAKAVLSWEPRINLVEGLKKTIPYFEDLLKKQHVREGILGSSP
jgi:UDP-glucuronate decarboxylase